MANSSRLRAWPRTPARKGLRIGTVLAVVAVVPLVGLGRSSYDQIRTARALQGHVDEVGRLAHHAVELARLDAALGDEKNWSAVRAVISALVTDRDAAERTLGADPAQRLGAAIRSVDALQGELAVPGLDDRLGAARRPGLGVAELVAAYDDAQELVGRRLDRELGNITAGVGGRIDEQRVVAATRNLRSAVELRRSVTGMIEGFYTSIFAVRDSPTEELLRLVGERREFEDRAAVLLAPGDADDELTAAVRTVTDSDVTVELLRSVDALVDRSVRSGVPDKGREFDVNVIIADSAGFGAVFATSVTTQADALRLVDLAGEQVIESTSVVERRADADLVQLSLAAAGLIILSLAAAWVGTAMIGRPLRRLEEAARCLSDGRPPPSGVIGGPVEVRAAGDAIRDAAVHLALVTEQTTVLATGDLDAPVLDHSAPGGLGAAVQRAVGTLRAALTQQDEFRRRLAHDAAHDGLTRLANRNASLAHLASALARAARSDSRLAVLYIDLDHFKEVNDHHGHHAGDTVLVTVAERLMAGVREGDHVGRLGGDEFVVIAEPVDHVGEAVDLARRLIAALDTPIEVGDLSVSVGASIGVAIAEHGDLTPDEILRDADLAAYRAKASSRGSVEVCDEDLRAELAGAADLSAAIRSAIDGDELLLHYQPIVEPDEAGAPRVRALEALVRWDRPGGGGLVAPDQFIAHAERSMLIVDLDRWVVREVARQLSAWRSAGVHDGTPVSINVSRRHLAHDHFVDHLLGPLEEFGIDPAWVIVEVTESALLDDLGAAGAKLEQLRASGIAVAIDDFGTGYTSLAHLRSLPVDILKLDRSFTSAVSSDVHEASIVKLIIDTAHLIGARITAEGVETAEEASILAGLGSDALQGYYFARPVRASEVRFGSLTRHRVP